MGFYHLGPQKQDTIRPLHILYIMLCFGFDIFFFFSDEIFKAKYKNLKRKNEGKEIWQYVHVLIYK